MQVSVTFVVLSLIKKGLVEWLRNKNVECVQVQVSYQAGQQVLRCNFAAPLEYNAFPSQGYHPSPAPPQHRI